MNTLSYKRFYHRKLPHIQPPGATFFITFRLEGSLPAKVWSEMRERLQALYDELAVASEDEDASLLQRERLWFQEYEEELHRCQAGPLWLQDDHVAALVADDFHHFDGDRYRLDAFCVMPNHVHAVLKPLPATAEGTDALLNGKLVTDSEERIGYLETQEDGQREFIEVTFHSLASILHSIKRHSAREANILLSRSGAFWQAESYDHYIRTDEEWDRTIQYVCNNPVKAGLVNNWREWRWTWRRTETK